MTLSGVISIMPVFLLKDLLDNDGYHSAEVLQDGIPVEPGCEIEENMTVQIFHNEELYGEYRVVDVVQASTPQQATQKTRAPMRAMSNADTYGFTMPIDNMALPRDIVLTDQNYGWRTINDKEQFHNGIDITNVNGVWIGTLKAQDRWDIRAVQGGQVVVSNNDTNAGGRGHYVVIKHQFSNIPQGMPETIYTYYQHLANRTVTGGNWIDQGTVVGKIGNSPGDVPVHLHFEIHIGSDGKHADPVTYLAGAPTYSGPDTHTCAYEYVWPEASHPHERYEQCTICGDLRSMGTYAATYAYTYYLTDHPHRQYGMCNMCNVEKFTGEHKTCNQVAIYPDGDHPHRRYRKYACGANEYLDSYMECNQVAIYVSEDHPHRRYRVYACGATEWLDSFGECNQVAIYPGDDHPHRRYRVYACGATEWLDSFGECKQAAIYTSETHPHRRYRVYECGADEWLDSYGECNQVAIYADGDHPHRRYRKYACGANEYLDSYMECKQVAIYTSETHPHRRYRVYACGADEWLDSYGTCTCK